MKRLFIPVVLVLAVVSGAYTIFAQQGQASDQSQQGMMGTMNCGGCTMMQGTVAATTDGGVVVSAGGKLVKYDAALKKVAEVTLDTAGNGTSQMTQGCPMMNMMK